MGNSVYLNLADGADPLTSQPIGEHQLGYKYDIPPAWFTLFDADDIVVSDENDGTDPGIHLIADINSALERLHERSGAMSAALGDRWSVASAKFETYLREPGATHVQVDLTELAEIFDSFEDLAILVRRRIGTFSVPYHSGKKKLFTRKPKVAELWQELLGQVRSRDDGLKAAVVFGCPDELDFDADSMPAGHVS